MRMFIKQMLRESLLEAKDEWFKAYNGRYIFNVKQLYELIDGNKIPYSIKRYSPFILKQYSHPDFSETDPNKLERLRNQIDYTKPLGLLVKFQDPESKQIEYILVDGNHRVRVASENNMSGLLYLIDDITVVNNAMKLNKNVSHELFPIYEKKQ